MPNFRALLIKIYRYLTDKDYRFRVQASRGWHDKMDDATYLKKMFAARMHYPLQLDCPRTFNEKLQWLKLYNRRPEYTIMVDKYRVREYIAEKMGEEYLIPLLGVWNDPDDIDFEALPNEFVLKCNHNSGLGMCICRDKAKLNVRKVKAALRKGLKQDYFLTGREWPYKNVPRKIIAEQFMIDAEVNDLRDYKFFCFDGVVDCVMVCYDRGSGDTKFYFFDRDWHLLRYNKRGKEAPSDFTVPKPANMGEMVDIAAKLSHGLPYARIDLYSVAGKTYFGEITFFPDSGLDANILPEMDAYWGKMIDCSTIDDK